MKKGLRSWMLMFSLVTILFSVSIFAEDDITITLRAVPSAAGRPIFVGDTFDVEVLLSVSTPPKELFSADLIFTGDSPNYRFGSVGEDLTSAVFSELAQNTQLSATGDTVRWRMEGDNVGMAAILTATPARLGTIQDLTATSSGPLAMQLSPSSQLVQQLGVIPFGTAVLYNPIFSNEIIISEHQCGDGFSSGTETESTCCIDTGCATDGNICYTIDNTDGVCEMDADDDGIIDRDDRCTSTPPGYEIFEGGANAGCIIGDIDLDQDIDPMDIAGFIAEYNHRDDGFASQADLNMDSSLGVGDIGVFIYHYNRRP